MPYSLRPLTLLFCYFSLLTSCKSPEPLKEHETQTFSNYQSAEIWIKQNYKAETVIPNSSFIKELQYYPASENGYLIIHLKNEKNPSLIYQNISLNIWNAFKKADSTGKFYNKNIQGNKAFILELKK